MLELPGIVREVLHNRPTRVRAELLPRSFDRPQQRIAVATSSKFGPASRLAIETTSRN